MFPNSVRQWNENQNENMLLYTSVTYPLEFHKFSILKIAVVLTKKNLSR